MHVGRSSRGHTSYVRQGTQGMLVREHVSLQETLAHEPINMQSMLTSEAPKHSRHVST